MQVDVFDALANPLRRALLGQLRDGPAPVHALIAATGRPRTAVSEHLAVLLHAGLVREEPRGRERYYHLEAGPLRELRDWLADYSRFWDERLDALESLLDQEPP